MKHEGYVGILFAPDGSYVCDFYGETVDEVINQLANRGSRWYFYPFEGVVKAVGGPSSRLVDIAPPLGHLKGKAVKTVQRYLASIPEKELGQLF